MDFIEVYDDALPADACADLVRAFEASGAAVPYAIYRDPARTRPWEAAGIVAGAAPGRALILTAYGRIEPADSAVPAGDYRDSVIITVDF